MNTLTVANGKPCAPESRISEPRTAIRGRAARAVSRAAQAPDPQEKQVEVITATFSTRWEW